MSPLPENSPTPDNEAERDLRTRFARQRRVDHEDAPAWRDEWLHAPATPPRKAGRWLPAALATACAALAVLLWAPFHPQPRLSEALPPLFEQSQAPQELFADLGPSFTVIESPSDFLLPSTLQSHLNLIHLP